MARRLGSRPIGANRKPVWSNPSRPPVSRALTWWKPIGPVAKTLRGVWARPEVRKIAQCLGRSILLR
jgi:hypothetical protein